MDKIDRDKITEDKVIQKYEVIQNEINWMALPGEYSKGKWVILPISYEKNLTYGQGASKGPSEIIKASKHLEYYDEELDFFFDEDLPLYYL